MAGLVSVVFESDLNAETAAHKLTILEVQSHVWIGCMDMHSVLLFNALFTYILIWDDCICVCLCIYHCILQ